MHEPSIIATSGFLILAVIYIAIAYAYPHERVSRIGQAMLLLAISVIIGSGILEKLAS